MSEHVQVERDDDVLAITLARPERRNAITVAMYAALADAFESAASDEGLRLITLRGEGQDLTAGNDLGDFMAELPRDGSDIPVWRLLRALARNEVPVVAGVHEGQLESTIGRIITTLRAKPAEALRLTHRLLRRDQTDELLERMELENDHFSERLTSAEVKDAITRFFASRSDSRKSAV